jgi:uncharacterized membrane protein YphA (DoxX/SURF4 family)
MKFDALRNSQETAQASDYCVCIVLGLLASVALALSPVIAIVGVFLVIRPWKSVATQRLYQHSGIRLAILSLCLLWLLSGWSAYRQGVFDGFDAAARSTVKSRPNQALLPTSMAVTPAADAPVAPTAAAADL